MPLFAPRQFKPSQFKSAIRADVLPPATTTTSFTDWKFRINELAAYDLRHWPLSPRQNESPNVAVENCICNQRRTSELIVFPSELHSIWTDRDHILPHASPPDLVSYLRHPLLCHESTPLRKLSKVHTPRRAQQRSSCPLQSSSSSS